MEINEIKWSELKHKMEMESTKKNLNKIQPAKPSQPAKPGQFEPTPATSEFSFS